MKVVKKEDKPLTTEEMRAHIRAEKADREDRATQRIKQVLEEERCVMNPIMTVTIQGVIPSITISALD